MENNLLLILGEEVKRSILLKLSVPYLGKERDFVPSALWFNPIAMEAALAVETPCKDYSSYLP